MLHENITQSNMMSKKNNLTNTLLKGFSKCVCLLTKLKPDKNSLPKKA